MVENIFENGVFKQILKCNRMPNQPQDYDESVNATSGTGLGIRSKGFVPNQTQVTQENNKNKSLGIAGALLQGAITDFLNDSQTVLPDGNVVNTGELEEFERDVAAEVRNNNAERDIVVEIFTDNDGDGRPD